MKVNYIMSEYTCVMLGVSSHRNCQDSESEKTNVNALDWYVALVRSKATEMAPHDGDLCVTDSLFLQIEFCK